MDNPKHIHGHCRHIADDTGPIGINCATYVGYDVVAGATGSHFLGIIGSFTATLALVMPSFIIVLALVKFYMKFHSNSIFEDTMSWLRPSVVGLIGAAAVIMMFDASWSGMPLFSDFKINVIDETSLTGKVGLCSVPAS